MKNNYIDGYIPVAANANGKVRAWYVNVNDMSLSQLVKFRNELIGYEKSIRALDAYIRKETNTLDLFNREASKQKDLYRSYKAYIKKCKRGK